MHQHRRPLRVWLASAVALLFGALTIKSGGAVLFFDGTARQAAGHYLPFVLWFNFAAGFFYIIAGVGLWLRRAWGLTLAAAIAVTTLCVFAALGIHIFNQGEYEMRTVIAMTLRSVIWVVISIAIWRLDRAAEKGAQTAHLS